MTGASTAILGVREGIFHRNTQTCLPDSRPPGRSQGDMTRSSGETGIAGRRTSSLQLASASAWREEVRTRAASETFLKMSQERCCLCGETRGTSPLVRNLRCASRNARSWLERRGLPCDLGCGAFEPGQPAKYSKKAGL